MLSYALITILMLYVATFGAPMMLEWFADSWDSVMVFFVVHVHSSV